MTQYAVIRTSRHHRPFIWSELQHGHLRQGWGSWPGADLRELIKKRRAHAPMTADEKAAWRNRRMLADTWNGLQPDDVLVLPNLPEPGRWVLARVAGPYRFEIADGQSDFGHLLPIDPIRRADKSIAVVDPSDPAVHARLRGTMRTMCRIWGIDDLGDAVDKLIDIIESGGSVDKPQTAAQRRTAFLDSVRDDLTTVVWSKLHETFRGAELEHLIVPLLESVYGPGTVERIGGAGEKGADLLVRTEGPLGLTYKIAIQVKMYDGTHHDLHPVEQLRWAREEHGVQAGVVLTTATEIGDAVQDELTKLSEELKIDIQAWTRDDFVRLLLSHLGAREQQPTTIGDS